VIPYQKHQIWNSN